MKAQANTGQPFRQPRHALTGVRCHLAAHDEVIGKAHQEASSLHAWLDLPLAPCSQDVREEELGYYGGNDAALGEACLRMRQATFFHAPGVPPLPNPPRHPPLFPPRAPPLASPGFVQTVAVSTDLCIPQPAQALVQARLTECMPRILGAAPLPQALGAVGNVLRVDRFHQHRHRALAHLVLARRLAARALAPLGFFEPDARSRWCLGAPTPSALVQGTPVLGEGLGLRVRCHPIAPCGARLARLARRLPEQVLVAQRGQGRADPRWIMGGLRRKALALWGDGWGSHGLSRRSVQPLVMPGGAFPPVGPVGLGSPPSQGLCAAKTATLPIAGRCAWRSRPDPWPASVACVVSPAGAGPGESRPVTPGPVGARSPSPG